MRTASNTRQSTHQSTSHPDLPARFASGAPLTEPDRATFYGGGAAGYTDYPPLAQTAAHVAA